MCGRSAGDVLDRDATEPVILHWQGSEWEVVDLPQLDRDSKAFFKVWGTGPDNVFAVGQRGVIARLRRHRVDPGSIGHSR